MKFFFILLTLLVAQLAVADVYSVRVDTSSTNLPTAFTTGSASKVIQNIKDATGVLIDNRLAAEMAVNCSSGSSTAPSDTDVNNVYVAAGDAAFIDTGLTGTCYARSMSGGAISTGIYTITIVTGRN